MSIDERYIALINADIDGEISPDDKSELDAFLADSAEGRELHEQLSSLCSTLDGQELLEPPTHLRHTVMNQLPKAPPQAESDGMLRSLFIAPAFRYAATFAAGVVMTILIVDSGQIQQHSFDDITRIVGTVADPNAHGPGLDQVTINRAEVAGNVTLRRAERIMILDFNLSTSGPVDIIARYSDKTVWFNGFAQLEATGTSISAADGEVRIQVDGKRRYAVFLHNAGSRNIAIQLQFFANGARVYEGTLEYVADGS